MHDEEFIHLTAGAICQRPRDAQPKVWCRACSLLGFAVATWGGTGHAQDASEVPAKAFHVAFTSSTSCTDESEFATRLRGMTSRWRPAVADEPAYTFFIHLSATQAGAHGQLGILEPGGSLTLREVETADCHTVLNALAFIGAVSADPLMIPPPQPLPVRQETARPLSPEQSPSVSPWHLGFGVGFGLEGAVAPRPSPAISAHAELNYATGALFDPRARLSGYATRGTAIFGDAGSASFTVVSARLALCPLRVQPFSWLDVRPCGLVDLGEFSSLGSDTGKEDSFLWSAAGAELMLDVLHTGPLTLGMAGGLIFPFRRDSFYFDSAPDESVHTIPAWSGMGSLSLSLRAF